MPTILYARSPYRPKSTSYLKKNRDLFGEGLVGPSDPQRENGWDWGPVKYHEFQQKVEDPVPLEEVQRREGVRLPFEVDDFECGHLGEFKSGHSVG